MAMPKTVHCKRCGEHVDRCGPLSARKLCEACSIAGVTEAAYAMIDRTGPAYEKWRQSMAAYGRELTERFGGE